MLSSLIGVCFLIFSNYYPRKTVLFLSIEVLVLPLIYIISNIYVESLVQQKHSLKVKKLTKYVNFVLDKYNAVLDENKELKFEIERLKYKFTNNS